MEQRLEGGDLRLIAACACIALVSLGVGTHFFYDAFPEATIDFKVTRAEARERAASFLEHRGIDLSSSRHAAVFDFDETAKTFLERELGLEGASAVIGKPVRLWRWSNRWFQELRKEEFRVQHTTSGQLVGYQHLVEEGATGAQLRQEAARRLAEQFLRQTIGIDPESLEFVEAKTTQRPHRADHAFTWKLSDFDIAGATYRYKVGVQGDLVGEYQEFLKVPETWRRQYQELRARNEATGTVASLFLFLTGLAMLARLLSSIRAQDVRWRTVLVFGGIAFVLTVLSQLNVLPVTIYNFDTTDTYSSFLAERLLLALAVGLASAVGIAFVVAGAEPEYRRWYGGQISVSEQFLPDGMRTRRFLIGTVIGLTMTAVFVAYQTIFYLMADHFGAWSPADIPYREMINTHIPWVTVLLIGFLPAVSEEFTSRAFSIPFLHRLLRHRWLAIVLSALVWGFAHAGYPQQPFWIRGLEVSLAGIAIGYVVVRWGILPALVWHYTIDALYTALILLRSSNPYFVISAALSVGLMLLPLVVAIVLYVRQRYFIDPVSLLNREDAPPLPKPRRSAAADLSPEAQILTGGGAPLTYHPLRPARLVIAAGVVGTCLAALLLAPPDPAPRADFALTGPQAEAIAREHLRGTGIDVDSLRTVASSIRHWDTQAVAYRHEQAGPEAAAALYEEALAPVTWRVRFYRPLQKEEWQVHVRPEDGAIEAVEHHQAEEAAGADLAEPEARAIAEAYMRLHGLEPSAFELKESSSERLPARRDHWFVWAAREGDPRNLGASTFRCEVHVAGDRVADLNRFVKLPEEWLRERDEGTVWRTMLRWLPILTMVAVAIHLLWLVVRQIRGGELDWRRPLWLGAAGALLFALGLANGLRTFHAAYPTQIPEALFLVIQVVGFIVALLMMGLVVAGAAGLAESMFPGVVSGLSRAALAPQVRDAVLLAALAAAGEFAWNQGSGWISTIWPAARIPTPPALPAVNGWWPALGGLADALSRALTTPMAAAMAIYYATRVLRRASIVIATLLILGACLAGANAWHVPGFFYAWGTFLLSAGVTAAAVAWLYRDNIVAYALTGFLTTSVEGATRLLEQTSPVYRLHGWIWIGVSALLVVCLWVWATRVHPARRGS